jgi:anion-transporting  ArsA/GET3 family ATPase
MSDSSPLEFALHHRRLLLFTGKGGVGKSTLVAALGVYAASLGLRPLIVELGHRATMRAIFQSKTIGSEPVEVAPNVRAINLDFESTLRAYFEEHVPIRKVATAIANNQTLGKFFRAAPAVTEIALLNRLRALVDAVDGYTKPQWQPVLVDLDATGHALMLFNLPNVLDGLVGEGPLRRLVSGFSQLLRDPSRTVLNLVTLPRELPVQETCELYRRLASEHAIPLGTVLVNQVPRDPLRHLDPATLERYRPTIELEGPQSRLDLELLLKRHRQARAALEQIERLREEITLPITCVAQESNPTASPDFLENLRRLGEVAASGEQEDVE